jgi:hypothetical protein
VAVREKREAYTLWVLSKDQDSREEYKRNSRDARTIIAEYK